MAAMPTDEMLAPLLTPWYRRVDPRMALILALSFGGHLALAIVAGQADPALDPFAAAFAPPTAAPAHAEFELVTVTAPEVPARPPDAGAAVPRTSALAATAPAARPSSARPDAPARPLDLAALAADLGSGVGPLPTAGARAPGADLASQLARARDQGLQVRLGDGRVARDESVLVGEASVPAWTLPGSRREIVGQGPKREAAAAPRVSLGRPIAVGPHAGTEFDPNPTIQGRYMAALQRCYKRALAADPRLTGRVELRFTVDPDGSVSDAEARASTTPMAEVATCVEELAADWRFSYRGATSSTFALRLVFVPGG